MANWGNLQLSVIGRKEDLVPFRKAAGRLKGRIDTSKSSVFLAEMEYGESRDLEAAGVTPFGRRFARAEYLFQGRGDDHGEHFEGISRQYPALAFVLAFGDPNGDAHGSYLLLNGKRRTWAVSARLHRQLMMKHYRKWKLLDSRGHVDYDAEDSDWAEWDAMFEMLEIAEKRWDAVVLRWLRERHPSRGRTTRVRTKVKA